MSQMIKLPQQEMSVEALRALIAEAEAPADGLYRWHETTDADPFMNNWFLYRREGGKWTYQTEPGGSWDVAINGLDNDVLCGHRVPYTPPPPTFQVGEWVINADPNSAKLWPTARKVVSVDEYVWTAERGSGGWWRACDLRPATPEEIAAATRIQPKVGMLLKRKSDGAVFRCYHTEKDGKASLVRLLTYPHSLENIAITSEIFEVIDSYTIEGVR